ncbi:MAG: PAAR domain-containing protein [Ilumatobacteraceae bacterium]
MGMSAAVQGDLITATCVAHQIPNPASGVPQPGPPFPFSAPVMVGCDPTVLIAGKPAVVVGASGSNTPPHVGLHLSDPHAVPALQQGTVLAGSPTVLVGGLALARTGSACSVCFGAPGQLVGSASTVLIA